MPTLEPNKDDSDSPYDILRRVLSDDRFTRYTLYLSIFLLMALLVVKWHSCDAKQEALANENETIRQELVQLEKLHNSSRTYITDLSRQLGGLQNQLLELSNRNDELTKEKNKILTQAQSDITRLSEMLKATMQQRTYEGPAFPDAVPRPSSRCMYPELLKSMIGRTLNDVADKLASNLSSIGMSDLTYYAYKDGFALVTEVEQIDETGTPLVGKYRFHTKIAPAAFSGPSLLSAFGRCVPGRYRMTVFLVTAEPTVAAGNRLSEADARELHRQGASKLDKSIADTPVTKDVSCEVLFYEFEKKDNQTNGVLVPSAVGPCEYFKQIAFIGRKAVTS